MHRNFLAVCFTAFVYMSSCKSKPSDEDIQKKVLLDYICSDKAKVNKMKILTAKEVESNFGFIGYEYTISGEVKWQSGCDEFGSNMPPGFKEKFENKKIILVKSDEGWR